MQSLPHSNGKFVRNILIGPLTNYAGLHQVPVQAEDSVVAVFATSFFRVPARHHKIFISIKTKSRVLLYPCQQLAESNLKRRISKIIFRRERHERLEHGHHLRVCDPKNDSPKIYLRRSDYLMKCREHSSQTTLHRHAR